MLCKCVMMLFTLCVVYCVWCDIQLRIFFVCISCETFILNVFYFFFVFSDELTDNMASSHRKESEALNVLLTEVVAVRCAAKKEYERKLTKFYVNRANHMKHGIFDGAKMPNIKFETGAYKENLHKNRELVQKAQTNSDQYFYAKNTSDQMNNELKQMAESLQKVMEIEQTIRKSESPFAHEQFYSP